MTSFKKLRKMLEIVGNGKLVVRPIEVSSFVRLHIAITGKVILIPSAMEKVEIMADENLVDTIQICNSGRTLYVSSEVHFRKPVFTECTIRIYIRQLTHLLIRCDGGDIESESPLIIPNNLDVKIQTKGNTSLNIHAHAIKLVNQSVGNVLLQGETLKLEVKNQSDGNFTADEMRANNVNFINMSNGNVKLFASETIAITHMGNGYIHYYGDAVLKDVKHFGNGPVQRIPMDQGFSVTKDN